MEFERELNEALAKIRQSDAEESATSAISQRLAVLLALTVLILPCGLLILVGIWVYRHLRALFGSRAPIPGDSAPLEPDPQA
jgi:hypothetical protein